MHGQVLFFWTGKKSGLRRQLSLTDNKVAEKSLILIGSLKIRYIFIILEVTLISLDY